MARRSMAGVKLTRLEARTRVIQGAGRIAFVTFCMAIGFVVVATAFPQRRALEKLEAKLELAKQREAKVFADREYHQIEHLALVEHAVGNRPLSKPGDRREISTRRKAWPPIDQCRWLARLGAEHHRVPARVQPKPQPRHCRIRPTMILAAG